MPLLFCHEIDYLSITFKQMDDQRVVKLKEIIGVLSPDQLRETFNTREKCLEVLAHAKWADGFVCRNCGNDKFCSGVSPYSRRCTRCKKDESASAHTIFHHCRIDLPRAFEIAYLVCGTPKIPASALSQTLQTRHTTCLNFKKRILNCIQSDGNLIDYSK